MTDKPIVPRHLAARDVEDAVDHYAAEAGVDVALRFIDSLAAAYRIIGACPASGSSRYA
ncbi:type II toxin-antitoxin system RelE/ParE family toxin [Sphingomonas sp. ZT3P38]